jgi:hypothetical protein
MGKKISWCRTATKHLKRRASTVSRASSSREERTPPREREREKELHAYMHTHKLTCAQSYRLSLAPARVIQPDRRSICPNVNSNTKVLLPGSALCVSENRSCVCEELVQRARPRIKLLSHISRGYCIMHARELLTDFRRYKCKVGGRAQLAWSVLRHSFGFVPSAAAKPTFCLCFWQWARLVCLGRDS